MGESVIFGHKFANIRFRKSQVFENFAMKLDLLTNVVVIDDTREKRNLERE
jgi:hypothetical protein